MEQLPVWLEAAVFAAGMTAYAEELDAVASRTARPADSAASAPGAAPDAIH